MELEGTPGHRMVTYYTEPDTADHDAMVLLDMLGQEQPAKGTPAHNGLAQPGGWPSPQGDGLEDTDERDSLPSMAWHRWTGRTANDRRWCTHLLDTTDQPIAESVDQVEQVGDRGCLRNVSFPHAWVRGTGARIPGSG